MVTDVARYYDELHRWTRKDAGFQTYSGFENDTIHRFLVDPDTGEFSPGAIYKFIDPLIPEKAELRGLDAGCGYGGSCFHYRKTRPGRWTGITISKEQWFHATALAAARGLRNEIQFLQLGYDDELPGRYDVIIAIESLIHTADPFATLNNLAAHLDQGGRLIIVDDMPVEHPPPSDTPVLDEFRRAWRCPVAPGAEEWKHIAAAAGLRLVAVEDLSTRQKPRTEADLDAALADLRAQRADKMQQGFGRLSDAEIGGLHLERLHRRGTIRYMLLAFEK